MVSDVSLKLLIHKTHRKILFGEADKKFIDFLFTILALPVATIVNLVSTESMVGPLKNLYQSVQNLNPGYFQEKYKENNESTMLKPKVQMLNSHISSISILPIESSLPKAFYKCSTSSCHRHFSTKQGVRCPECNKGMSITLKYVQSSHNDEFMREESLRDESGYVKDNISYMVMEDLTVKPMSAMSSISMLAEFGVYDSSLIEEKVVYLDMEEGLNLLRALFHTSTVLSDVFLQKIDFGNSDCSTILEEEKVAAESKKETHVECFCGQCDLCSISKST